MHRTSSLRLLRRGAHPGVTGALALAAGARVLAAQAPLGEATTDSPVSLERSASVLSFALAKASDRTQPVIRLGYQSLVGEATRTARAANQQADVRNVPYFGVSLTGVPSSNIASIFGAGRLSAGADLQISYGRAYVLSYVPSRIASVVSASIAGFSTRADGIAARRKERNERPGPTPARLTAIADADRGDTTNIKGQRQLLDSLLHAPNTRSSLRDQLSVAVAYADDVLAFARGDDADKPAAPNPLAALARRGGPVYDAWFVRAGANAGTATLFDGTRPFAEQFSTRDYQGYSAQAGYSVRFGGTLPVILAGSGGVTRSSNVDELSSIDVTETQTYTSADGVTQRSTSRKRTGLVGDLAVQTKAVAKFDAVLYPFLAGASRDAAHPRSTIAFDLFTRATRTLATVYGVGAYLTQPGSPTSVYGGVNIYRATDRRLAFDLVAGFPF